jgi:antitoxin HicB
MSSSFSYSVTLTPASSFDPRDKGYVVTFPDVPEAITEGDDEAEALARAVDALETAFIARIASRQDIPDPRAKGDYRVALPALSAAKVGLYKTMRAAGVGKGELARRIGWHLPQVDRLLDLRHASRLDRIETALRALGKTLVVDVAEDAA